MSFNSSGYSNSSNSGSNSNNNNNNSGSNGADDTDEHVKIWRFKRVIKMLENARGNGTSMISLIIPPKKQISEVSRLLAEEEGTATNIKSRVNRLSVLSAISSGQQKLKLYTRVPKNGLVIFCGTAMTEDGKERRLNIDFEPIKPVNTFLYYCDSKFHTEPLSALLECDARFGFIVMDGNGTLFGVLSGSNREILHRFQVELPKKHGRGGQSALRFARLREEKRHNYVRKVAELAVQMFITNDRVNVAGIVLAGSADFKTELGHSDMLDKRVRAAVINQVDIAYGGEKGFNQAIELSAEFLQNVKYMQEKKLIVKFFDEISLDTGKYCYGMEDTLRGLELGAVETLIIWEGIEINRYVLRIPGSHDLASSEVVKYLTPEQETERTNFLHTLTTTTTTTTTTTHPTSSDPPDNKSSPLFTDASAYNSTPSVSKGTPMETTTTTSSSSTATVLELETIEKMPLLEWMVEHYKEFGTTLEIVSDKSQEGSQFVRGFGGIGGLLRYKVDFNTMNMNEEDYGEFLSDDEYI